jgi:hypothetical protein
MPDEPARRELDAAPPFLSWTGLYVILAVTLAFEIVLFAAITAIYR